MIYPYIKSAAVSGEAINLTMNEVLLSLAINVPENKEKKESPKTAIPGARVVTGKIFSGTLFPITDNKSSTMSGNPSARDTFKGSRNISF